MNTTSLSARSAAKLFESGVCKLLGVPASRIEAVSFGREKPRALGDTEEAWAQNRRADIVYR